MKSDILTITEAAKQHFLTQIAKRDDGWGIYVGIKTAGCSGLAYVVEYWDGIQCQGHGTNTRPHEINGVNIVIDQAHEYALMGMELDFVKEGLNEGLKFNNPNTVASCGCGETFTVK